MKKFIIFLLSITMAVCVFAGCKKKNDDGGNNNIPAPEPTIETANFVKDRYVIDLYDSAELIVESFAGKTVTYASSDETVATVDKNGLAIGLKAGEATVTAESGGVKAVCTVVVAKTDYIPTIELEQDVVSVDTAEAYSMNVTAKFNGKTILDDIGCAVTLADGADETIATATVSGREITVQGLTPGETEFYVSANVRGKYLNKKFTVKVVDLGYSIKPNDDDIDISLEGYETSIYTRTETGANVEKKLSFDVYDGRTLVDNAEITWASENDDIAAVEQKNGEYYVVAKKGGVAKIVGSYVNGDNSASVSLSVNVEKVVKSEPLDIGVTPVIGKYNETVVSIPTDKLGGEFTQISYKGKVLSTGYTTSGNVVNVTLNDVNRNVIPDSASLLGDNFVDVEDECYKYRLPVKLCTLAINSDAELKTVATIADGLGGDGYYLLGSDVTVSGYWYNYDNKNDKDIVNYCIGFKKPFVGTFDGAGHTISGINLHFNWGNTTPGSYGYGFIYALGKGGTLKNVGFIDTILEEKGGIVKRSEGGVVENVYIKYSARGMNQNTSATFCGIKNDDGNGKYAYDTLTLRNVVIDFNGKVSSASFNASAKLLGKFSANSVFENVAVYGFASEFNDKIMATRASVNETPSTSIDKIFVYNSDTCVALGTLPAASVWGDCWNVKEGSLPVFKSAASAFETGASFAASAATIKAGESATFTAGKNCVIELSDGAVDLGVTYAGGVVSVPASITPGTTFKVISRNIFDAGSYVEQSVIVLGEVLDREIDLSSLTINLGATVSGNTVTATASDTEIDLNSVYTGSSAIATLTLNDSTIDSVTVTNGKFNLKANSMLSAYGKTNVIVTVIDLSSGLTYRITLKNIFVITKTVTDEAGLRSMKTISAAIDNGGYFELGNNITLSNSWYNGTDYSLGVHTKTSVKPFVGTIDGKGYAINGFKNNKQYQGFGFITNLGNGGVLKNVAFLKVELKEQDAIVSYSNGGIVENVYVQITTRNGVQGKSGVFGINDGYAQGQVATAQILTLKNVVVDYSGATFTGGAENSVLLGKFTDMSKHTNVAVIGVPDDWKGKIAKKAGDSYTTDGIYVTDTAGATVAGTFPASGWDSTYWTVTDTAVTWKTK